MKIRSDRLKSCISKTGMSITAFAEKCGVGRTTISQLCNGSYQSDPSDYIIEQLSKALHVSPQYLTGESEHRTLEEQIDTLVLNHSQVNRTADLLSDLLINEDLLEGQDAGFILHGKSQYDYVEMSRTEKDRFLRFLRKRIIESCLNYVDACQLHDTYARQPDIKGNVPLAFRDTIPVDNKK